MSGRSLSEARARPLARLTAVMLVAAFACVSSAHLADPAATDAADPVRAALPAPAFDAEPHVARAAFAPELTAVRRVTAMHARAPVTGEATYYADKFEGRRTASGIRFRQAEMYAAHRTLPFGTVVRVTNVRNGRSVVVRVVDRGPWGSTAKRRNTIIDLSRSAAERLDYIRAGRAPVRLEVMLWGVS